MTSQGLTPLFQAAGIDLNRITGILHRTGQREEYDFNSVQKCLLHAEMSGVSMERLEIWAGFEVAMHLNKHLFPGGPDGTPVDGTNPFWEAFQNFTPDDLLVLARGGALTVPLRTRRLVGAGVSPEFLTALPLVGMDDKHYWGIVSILGHVEPKWIEGALGSSDAVDDRWKVMLKREARELAALYEQDVPVEYARQVFAP